MRTKRHFWIFVLTCMAFATFAASATASNTSRTSRLSARKSAQRAPRLGIPGQSATLLPNGKWLLIGGESPNGPVTTIAVRDPQTGAISQLDGKLATARAWHTATLLPDG